MKRGAVNEPAKQLKLFSWKSAQTQEIKILSRPSSKDVKSPWTMSFPGTDVYGFLNLIQKYWQWQDY